MAQRRMFSLKVIDTDEFLDMPQTAQLLYYHLAMRADDDGFISNPKRISKIVGSGDDDMKILVVKKFVIPFDSGVCVIKHWRIHNLIRGDRYTETGYLDEKKLLNEVNGKYELSNGLENVIPNGNQMEPQVRLGKDSIGKDNILLNKLSDKDSSLKEKNDKDYEHFLIWYKYYPRKVGKPNAYKAWKRLKPDKELKEKMVVMVLEHSKSKQWQSPDFIPYPATWINQERWNDTLPQDNEEDK